LPNTDYQKNTGGLSSFQLEGYLPCFTSLFSASITAILLLTIKRRVNLLANRTLLFHSNRLSLSIKCFRHGLKLFLKKTLLFITKLGKKLQKDKKKCNRNVQENYA
jgi:hypothetical protein